MIVWVTWTGNKQKEKATEKEKKNQRLLWVALSNRTLTAN